MIWTYDINENNEYVHRPKGNRGREMQTAIRKVKLQEDEENYDENLLRAAEMGNYKQ